MQFTKHGDEYTLKVNVRIKLSKTMQNQKESYQLGAFIEEVEFQSVKSKIISLSKPIFQLIKHRFRIRVLEKMRANNR
jgi:hypothetical protein